MKTSATPWTNYLSDRVITLSSTIVVLGIVLSIVYPQQFASWDNFSQILLNLSIDTIVAVGMMVLMIGGNIPGETRVLSVAIYGHVEALEFAEAHRLAGGMVAFAMVVLVTLYLVNRPRGRAVA